MIQARRVGFAYPGGHLILDDFTATLEHGALSAIIGPSGAGKSTLLYLLGLLLRPPSGTIELVFGWLRDAADAGAAVLVATHSTAVVERCDAVVAV